MFRRLSPDAIADVCARHPWRVVAIWVAVLAVCAPLAAGVNDQLHADWAFSSEPESVRGQEIIDDRLRGAPEPLVETVVLHAPGMTVDDAAFQQRAGDVTARLAALDDTVVSATSYFQARDLGLPAAEQLVSADRHTALVQVTLAGDKEEALDNVAGYLDAVHALDGEDVRVLTVGQTSILDEYSHIAESDLIRGETIAIPFAMVILLIVFRAVVAALLPLALAIASILVALALTALIARGWELSVFAANMITMIGLAVGIDYALFIVERYREERRHGVAKHDAIVAAGRTASRAVVFSGMTVVLSLLGLLLIPTTIFRSLGLGSVITVIVAVVVVLTLVPALLSLLGDRINWPRRQHAANASAGQPHGFWVTAARVVMRRPVLTTVVSAGILVLLTMPALDIRRTQSGVETFPPSDLKSGFDILSRDFAAGLVSPIHVVIDAPRTADIEAATEQLRELAAEDPGVAIVAPVEWNAAGDAGQVTMALRYGPEEEGAFDVVRRMREAAIPAAFGSAAGDVLVAGRSAQATDFIDGIDGWTPMIFGFVLAMSFVLLLLAFRSIVVPLKALVMNLLSVGAAYGLMVLVFQDGIGAGLLGFQQVEAIESWIPIFLFCVLFGLSMDYHVFLLSRIQEQFRATDANAASVAAGLRSTGRIITGAALIMVVVFSGFAMGDMVMFQQMGFGLAVAILLDATLVRTVLVPASMALLGNLNWYLPGWLGWLPDLRVEGHAAADPIVIPDIAPPAPAVGD